MADVQIRPRVDADLPGLIEALAWQQPVTHYPLVWPLPFPAEQLLRSGADLAAWTAELSGRPVGHIGLRRVDPTTAHVQAWMSAHRRPADRLAEVAALFVGSEVRGMGVGGLLLAAAVDWAARHDLALCLVVVSSAQHGRRHVPAQWVEGRRPQSPSVAFRADRGPARHGAPEARPGWLTSGTVE